MQSQGPWAWLLASLFSGAGTIPVPPGQTGPGVVDPRPHPGQCSGNRGVRGPTALAWTWEGPDPHWTQLSPQAACHVAHAQAKTQPPAR